MSRGTPLECRNTATTAASENILLSGGAPAIFRRRADVVARLFKVQSIEMAAQCDSLFELPKSEGIELLIQFRLSRQHDLQQLPLRCLQIREQANFLQEFRERWCASSTTRSVVNPVGVAAGERRSSRE